MADAAELRRRFDALARAYPPGQHGRWAARQRSDALDAWFVDAFEGVAGRVALLALGGYGRGLQLPGSDIDVLLVHDDVDAGVLAELGERLWYPLWDQGWTVTPLVRTPAECVEAARERLDSRTAMLDGRVIAGASALGSAATDPVVAEVVRDPAAFAHEVEQDRVRRASTAGSCAADLSPDLKDGLGGLRDIAALGWLARAIGEPLDGAGVVRHADLAAIDEAEEFLVRARSAVQLETGKRVDRLSADVQPEVAASMGFDDEPGLPAIDGLMRTVFEHARTVDAVVRTALARTIAGPSAGPTAPLAGPADVLEALAAADGTIAPVLVDAVAAAAIPSPVAWDARTRDAFLALIRRGEGGVAALDVLDRVGALERFVPGWPDVRSRPQRDPYHRFTVDGHLLRTLAGVDALLEDPSGDPIAAELAAALPDLGAVALGALLHDIGKVGRGEHVPVGAEVARAQVAAMGLEQNAADLVSFMVAEHLLLPDTATRRDLTDENLILDAAATIGTVERLAALYLLAVADAAATGPAAWTPWRQALIRELVTKVRHVLERGTMGVELAASLTERTGGVRALLTGEPDRDVDAFVLRMPRGYFLSVVPARAARHFRTIAPFLTTNEVRTAAAPGEPARDLRAPRRHERPPGAPVLCRRRPRRGRDLDPVRAGVHDERPRRRRPLRRRRGVRGGDHRGALAFVPDDVAARDRGRDLDRSQGRGDATPLPRAVDPHPGDGPRGPRRLRLLDGARDRRAGPDGIALRHHRCAVARRDRRASREGRDVRRTGGGRLLRS